ncbi:MAG: RsiV family protein, partial [Clostridium sp.]
GLTTLVGYNFNPKTGNLLSLNDLFKSQSYIPYIKDYIITKINSQSDVYFDDATITVQSLKSFNNFYLTNNELVIFFNQYDIAPYSSGIPEFKIPLKNLNIYLNPKYKS